MKVNHCGVPSKIFSLLLFLSVPIFCIGTITFSEAEGVPMYLDLNGKFLAIVTNKVRNILSFLYVYMLFFMHISTLVV